MGSQGRLSGRGAPHDYLTGTGGAGLIGLDLRLEEYWWFGLLGFARLARIMPMRACEHPLRRLILQLVERAPGSRFTDVWKRVDVGRSTVAYHLMVLEQAGALKTFRRGRILHYFPTTLAPVFHPQFAALQRGRARTLAWRVMRQPGSIQSVLSQELRMSRKMFREYAEELILHGLIREHRAGKHRQYFGTERLLLVIPLLTQSPGAVDEALLPPRVVIPT